MNKQIIGAVLGVIGAALNVSPYAAASAQGRSHHEPPHFVIEQSTRRLITPLTPAMKAKQDKIWHLDQAAAAALDAGEYAEAEAAAQESVSLGIASGQGQEYLATALNAQGKTQEAMRVYKQIADEGDVFPRNLVPYAVLLLKTGQWAQAVVIYNRQLPYLSTGNGTIILTGDQFSPTVPQPKKMTLALHIAQGLMYYGDAPRGARPPRDMMMSEFDQALRLAPNSPLANYYYGFGWQQLDLNSRLRAVTASRAKAALQKAAMLGTGTVKKAAEEALQGVR